MAHLDDFVCDIWIFSENVDKIAALPEHCILNTQAFQNSQFHLALIDLASAYDHL